MATKSFNDIDLYCIATLTGVPSDYEGLVRKLCAGGADVVQFRDKNMSDPEKTDLGRRLKRICSDAGVLFIVNDSPEIALSCGADGVHLGQDGPHTDEARRIMCEGKHVGRSAHSLSEALKAEKEGADYVSCGPIWGTPTKPGYLPVGPGLIKVYREGINIPFVAIGGIDATNVEEVIKAGAGCVAVVRAVCAAPDPEKAAKELKEKIIRSKNVDRQRTS